MVGRQHGIDIDEIGFLGGFPSTVMSHNPIVSLTGAPRQTTAGNSLLALSTTVVGHLGEACAAQSG